MKKLTFHIIIDAPPQRVWEVLFGESTYPLWTCFFSEGSRAETDWKKGSKALFFDGGSQGMVAEIAESIPYEFLSIKHLGTIKDGVEDLTSEKSKAWSGFLENYTLKKNGKTTELIIDLDDPREYKDFFEKTWPQALEKVKELAEMNTTMA